MATNEYITLCSSGSEIDKKFYAILNGYTERHVRGQTVDINVEGAPLITNGGIYKAFDYILKLTHETLDPSFGNKDDLIALFDLNDPNGSPSDVITLVDHYGEFHHIKFTGDLEVNPLTVVIEGEDSYFYTPIRVIEVTDE